MKTLQNKIDFALVIGVKNANPNGDPMLGNRPRTDMYGYGIITDVCLKRKLRNRMDDLGAEIFFRAPDRSDDGFQSLQERAENTPDLDFSNLDTLSATACKKWLDVRSFGQLFAFPSKGKKGKKAEGEEEAVAGVSVGIRGPVTIQQAKSLNLVDIEDLQIAKCFNGVTAEKGKKGSDTLGHKFCVPFGVYVAYGSINARLAQKTGLTEEDVALIRESLQTLFENDESADRPSGSMEVLQVIWWEHKGLDASVASGVVHRSLNISVPNTVSSFDEIKMTATALPGVTLSTMPDGLSVDLI